MQTVIIGAGPAGMMAAISASKNSHVILIDKNDELGKKLKITGGGRCNITNKRDISEFFDKIVRNEKFLYSSFYSFTNDDLISYFEDKGLEFKVEDDFKIYPKGDKSIQIIDALETDLINKNVKIMKNKTVKDLIVENNCIKGVLLDDGKVINADKVIVCTGGKSYPGTGSDGNFYEVLKAHNHKIECIYPALAPIIVKESFVKNISGVSFKDVNVKINDKKFKNISLSGDILFAHFGLTGPVILNLSSYINRHLNDSEIEIIIDFLPNISKETLSNKIRENSTKTIYNNLKDILALNFIKEILTYLNIDKKPCELTKLQESKIISIIKESIFTCVDIKGIDCAIVTSGGVSTKNIDASTMQSKIVNGLYFAGEVIDVDGQTGGYNLQVAFSTGYLAGQI